METGFRRHRRHNPATPFSPSVLDRALRRPRGFATALELGALVCTLGLVGALVLCFFIGAVLSQRDRARAGEASATKRADVCAAALDRETRGARALEERVRLHIAIDDDRCPCVCGDPQ